MPGRNMQAHPWHVLGTGSIGGLFCARLATAGSAATVLLRNAGAREAWHAAGGLLVEHADGHRQQIEAPVRIPGDGGPLPRHLLVATKAPDTLAALAPWLPGDGEGQLVLLLQNGMGTSEQVRARWPRVRLWNAVTTAGAWRETPFHLHCVADGETRAGRWDDAGNADLDAAVEHAAAAGLWQCSDDIRVHLWRKLAINAVINGLTAIHRCRNGELLEIAAAQAQLAPLAREVEAVAAADDVVFDEPVLALAERVIHLTAANYSSMNRDVAAGRRTEIDFINGYVVERAHAHGIAVPANGAVLAAVHALA